MIQTRSSLVPDTTSAGGIIYGKAMVYDAVGNLVAAGLPILPAPFDDRLYYILWNGSNLRKRKAASGVYLIRTVVRYVNHPESPVSVRAKFGIIRK